MVNYPKGIRPRHPQNSRIKKQKTTHYASRGMSFEDRVNDSNKFYASNRIAVIHKKPTPIQIVKVDYPRRSAAKITEAYFRHASTTDYNGIYLGKYIDFEAKEITNTTRFPLSNIQKHQLSHMEACEEQGGIVFLLISFKKFQEVFLLPFDILKSFMTSHNRKSIPYEYIKEYGYLCSQGTFPLIDYLKAVDSYLLDRDQEKG